MVFDGKLSYEYNFLYSVESSLPTLFSMVSADMD
jgi:hypothetical protein